MVLSAVEAEHSVDAALPPGRAPRPDQEPDARYLPAYLARQCPHADLFNSRGREPSRQALTVNLRATLLRRARRDRNATFTCVISSFGRHGHRNPTVAVSMRIAYAELLSKSDRRRA